MKVTSRWFQILQEHEIRRIRKNVIVSVYAPIAAGILIVALISIVVPARIAEPDNEFGGSSGGGGGELETYDMEFGPTEGDAAAPVETPVKSVELQLLKIRIIRPGETAPKPALLKKKPSPKKTLAASPGPPPVRRIRGMGPGTGGGAGGGSGGGIGAGIGSSIDWGGSGGRRLLSGRIPKYPPGTDAEMPIAVQFTVLPDGSVSRVVPTRQGNELLVRAAVSAVMSWRFEPLPPETEQRTQSGDILFHFKLETTTRVGH